MKKVYVEIDGSVTNAGETDRMNYSTEGSFCKKSGKYYIHYTEGTLLGAGECKTTIKVSPNGVVTMLRSGEANTQMIFEAGRRHISCYETEYGNLTVGVTAGKVLIDMNDNGGKLDIDYSLTINNVTKSRNRVVVRVRA